MRKTILAITAAIMFSTNAMAQGDVYERSKIYEWPTDKQVVNKLHQWQDLKFGVLFHWGLYAVPGIVESWSICDEDWVTRDTTMTYQQYKDWYWGQADKFNPTDFNPEQWANVMSDAGMKYMIFTTKHHDGFCMFDSKYTDFSIAHHAFKNDPRRDVLKYVNEAFRKKNFMIGTYFSKPDWHSQDYWWDVYPTKRGRNVNYDIKKWPWRWNAYKEFTYNQMNEILSRYGKVDILWMDGGWVCKENNQDIDMPRIAEMARRNQPGIIMVDRTIHGPYENYQTPERTIPETQLNYPWESCIPLTNDWGYVNHPTWKSTGNNPARGCHPSSSHRQMAKEEWSCHLQHHNNKELPLRQCVVHSKQRRQAPLCNIHASRRRKTPSNRHMAGQPSKERFKG